MLVHGKLLPWYIFTAGPLKGLMYGEVAGCVPYECLKASSPSRLRIELSYSVGLIHKSRHIPQRLKHESLGVATNWGMWAMVLYYWQPPFLHSYPSPKKRVQVLHILGLMVPKSHTINGIWDQRAF